MIREKKIFHMDTLLQIKTYMSSLSMGYFFQYIFVLHIVQLKNDACLKMMPAYKWICKILP